MKVFQSARFMIFLCLCVYTTALILFFLILKSDVNINPKYMYNGTNVGSEVKRMANEFVGFFRRLTLPSSPSSLPLCPEQPPNLGGKLNASFSSLASRAIQNLKPGGTYKPSDCRARERTAILIPYRDRPQHLNVILPHLHTLLQRQQLEYGIYVVEMELPTQFNRGILANIGFEVASKESKDSNYTCYVVHDVDHVPQDDRNLYRCGKNPRHLVTTSSKFRKLPYQDYLGGVLAMTPGQFRKMNGYSNLYFGWGGEDDDVLTRIRAKNMTFERPAVTIGAYKALPHDKDKTNPVNPNRFKLVNGAKKRMGVDGLNSLRYSIKTKELRQTYTWVLAHVVESDFKAIKATKG